LFDTHCHFYLDSDRPGQETTIQDALDNSVTGFLVPGIDYATSVKAITLSRHYPGVVFAAVGIHPNYSHEAGTEDLDALIRQSPQEVRAIGEIGLDFYRTFSPREKQFEILETMLELAKTHQLPICLHNRDADTELINALSPWYSANDQKDHASGIFHAFDGSAAIAEWGIANNFFFGIGGLITYKKSDGLRDKVREIGLERLVLETDSPYMTPVPHRGEKNTPSNLKIIVKVMAECLNASEERVIQTTDRNAKRLLGLKEKNA